MIAYTNNIIIFADITQSFGTHFVLPYITSETVTVELVIFFA